MRKNRKKVETYRFNGVWGIKPLMLADLKREIVKLEAKLVDPNDCDDKDWVAVWLSRYRRESDKKQEGVESKLRSRKR